MKCIVSSGEGGIAITYPALNARLVKRATIKGKPQTYRPAIPFYKAQRESGMIDDYASAVTSLQPQWAETEAQFYARMQQKVGAGATLMDASQLPPDRTFRAAWTATGGKVSIDMPKARDVWRDRMRAARTPLLASLDVAVQRADEIGDAAAKSAAIAKKQQLRDVTAASEIDAAQTPNDLVKVWPGVLTSY